ncbi:hypothetical protein B1A59_05535 [Corynebacterium diphtheriae]|nr:hypothetical protein B1A59_05535 [Corynebacterium diphtheriae]
MRWWARHPRSPPKKAALHTKSAQTADLEVIWCEVLRKILRNTLVWWLFRFWSALIVCRMLTAWIRHRKM